MGENEIKAGADVKEDRPVGVITVWEAVNMPGRG